MVGKRKRILNSLLTIKNTGRFHVRHSLQLEARCYSAPLFTFGNVAVNVGDAAAQLTDYLGQLFSMRSSKNQLSTTGKTKKMQPAILQAAPVCYKHLETIVRLNNI